MDETTKRQVKLIEIYEAIRCLTEVLGYAKGQRNIYNQLDPEGQAKYEDLFTLKELIEGLQTARTELGFQRISLEQELCAHAEKSK